MKNVKVLGLFKTLKCSPLRVLAIVALLPVLMILFVSIFMWVNETLSVILIWEFIKANTPRFMIVTVAFTAIPVSVMFLLMLFRRIARAVIGEGLTQKPFWRYATFWVGVLCIGLVTVTGFAFVESYSFAAAETIMRPCQAPCILDSRAYIGGYRNVTWTFNLAAGQRVLLELKVGNGLVSVSLYGPGKTYELTLYVSDQGGDPYSPMESSFVTIMTTGTHVLNVRQEEGGMTVLDVKITGT